MQYTTPNKSNGKNTCQYIILHHTATGAGTAKSVVKRFCTDNGNSSVSCHYVVDTNGDVYKVGNHTDILRHAGDSKRGKLQGMNKYSIGIEVVGPLSDGSFTAEQRDATSRLIKDICTQHSIGIDCILRHKDVSPGRKVDIYDSFWDVAYSSWDEYKKSIFGDGKRWYDEAVDRAVANRITTTSKENFHPERMATRAEVVQFLKNFAENIK